MVKRKSQFKAILRKDMKLVFSWKAILLIIGVPFIMMFAIVGIPSLIVLGSNTTISICNDDIGGEILDFNGTLTPVYLGQWSILAVQEYANTNDNIEIKVVETRDKALNASNGIYFPANFTIATFSNQSVFEYRKSGGEMSLQGYNLDTVLTIVQQVIFGTFLTLRNITEENIPISNPVQYIPPMTDVKTIWSQDTMKLATPFAYALFILLSLTSGMIRSFGFSKEKEDGTFETMISITKNRSHIVYSKLIIGLITTCLTIFAYFAGSIVAGAVSSLVLGNSEAGAGITDLLAIPYADLLSYKGVILVIGLGLALILTMLGLMTMDTLFTRNISERIAVPLILGVGLLFMLPVMISPGQANLILYINPYYWIFHVSMSIADLSFKWVDAIYLLLFIGLLGFLAYAARKAIEREKILFT